MNFVLFPVETTNIFPIANSVNGGQLVTEFNLKSRESVSTDPTVEYSIGPSFTHSMEDFYVRNLSDSSQYFENQASTSSTILEIMAGRAVVDGHYVESLASVTIDLAELNSTLSASEQLTGNLSVGLRIMYSTTSTMSGSILSEESDMYTGVQVVILPTDQFLLPTSYTSIGGNTVYCGDAEHQNLVTAHLLLATFQYVNGAIVNINNNPNKMQSIPAERIGSIDSMISSTYVRKTGLNPDKIYAFAGKGENPETGYDTWCDATDSLIVWDALPQITSDAPTVTEAQFITGGSGKTFLVLPHKQIDNGSSGYQPIGSNGSPKYYQPKILGLPLADFNAETAGTVNSTYTANVKRITSQISQLYSLTNGKQRAYVDILSSIDDLPKINKLWNPGDYVLVGQDMTQEYDGLNSEARAPSTIYVVLPGRVIAVHWISIDQGSLDGQELANVTVRQDEGGEMPDTTDPEVYNSYWGDLSAIVYRGTVGHDFFTYTYIKSDGTVMNFYYVVSDASEEKVYSDQIYITRPVPFATQSTVGGFIDIDPTATDNGYVYLDSEGHLRLLDYDLLRSGTLAYQLGEDFTVPSGLTIDAIQAYLNEYVNQRVAFPNANQAQNAENPNVINVTINLPGDDVGGTLDIFDIDSRFGAAVNIILAGSPKSNVTINVSDCQRVRIDPLFIGSDPDAIPQVNIYRSCIYYDVDILNHAGTIKGMSLWYDKKLEPGAAFQLNITIDDMTVIATPDTGDAYMNVTPASIDFWTIESLNDNHFTVGLKSITFDSDGYVCGCGVLVRNDTTSNISLGKSLIHDINFELPQSTDFPYPRARMNKAIEITGTAISAYPSTLDNGYIVTESKFSLRTPVYDSSQNIVSGKNGEAAFISDSYILPSITLGAIDVFSANTFHYFTGIAPY